MSPGHLALSLHYERALTYNRGIVDSRFDESHDKIFEFETRREWLDLNQMSEDSLELVGILDNHNASQVGNIHWTHQGIKRVFFSEKAHLDAFASVDFDFFLACGVLLATEIVRSCFVSIGGLPTRWCGNHIVRSAR